jgi:hypothetical protein
MRQALSRNPELLRGLDFELAYLALLTVEGLKPLSRWERRFDAATEECLRDLGLKTCMVERFVQIGGPVYELLLSNSHQLLQAYTKRFAGSPISHDAETVRFEGRLFGYPACCVESYATHGYARNSLRRRDQRVLFHWACSGCAITPLLLPDYWRVYRLCRASTPGRARSMISDLVRAFAAARPRPRVALALSLAALGILPSTTLSVAADPLDPHVTAFTLYDDPDGDFLLGNEEFILGFNPAVSDQNTNAVADGVDLAHQLSTAVDALPIASSMTNAFVTHHMAFGLEDCLVCGDPVNMGFLEVCHPLEDQTIALPYIAKHFLEHGSFSYSGSVHSGRVNPPLLKFIVESDGRGHLISEPAGTDQDHDGLRNWEEPAFETGPQMPDTDEDHLVDGIDTAREVRRALGALPAVSRPEDGPIDRPFVVTRSMNGLETCPRCGEVWTMGLWEIINPVTSDTVTIPTMALHYLEHGAFGWKGGQLLGGQGRVDPRQLQAVLTGNPNPHLLAVTPDTDGDWLSDHEEVSLGGNPAKFDEDANTVQDGLDLARAVVCEVAGLPTAPSSTQVYRVDVPLRGLEQCKICATNVNMGHLTVCNPQARLSLDIPYIGLHYLEHDGFSFAGDVHGTGRIDIKLLLDILFRPAVTLEVNGPQVTLRWMTKAGRTYQIFTAPDLSGSWANGPVIQGDGTEKVITESKPPGAARRFYRVAVW